MHRVPLGLPPEQAVLTEPLACCMNGQEPLGIGIGQSVVIIGAGLIGLFHAELALAKGASLVLVADVVRECLEEALSLGEGWGYRQ